MGSGLSRFSTGEGEPSGSYVVISEEESHASTPGDANDFLKVILRAATEKTIGKRFEMASTTRKSTAWSRLRLASADPAG
jgi:hypothetical protein